MEPASGSPDENKIEHDELSLHEMHYDTNGLVISLSGEPTRQFMAHIIRFFESVHAKNFLALTVENTTHRYSITIENLNGSDSPAGKIERLRAENKRLKAILDEREISCEQLDV